MTGLIVKFQTWPGISGQETSWVFNRNGILLTTLQIMSPDKKIETRTLLLNMLTCYSLVLTSLQEAKRPTKTTGINVSKSAMIGRERK